MILNFSFVIASLAAPNLARAQDASATNAAPAIDAAFAERAVAVLDPAARALVDPSALVPLAQRVHQLSSEVHARRQVSPADFELVIEDVGRAYEATREPIMSVGDLDLDRLGEPATGRQMRIRARQQSRDRQWSAGEAQKLVIATAGLLAQGAEKPRSVRALSLSIAKYASDQLDVVGPVSLERRVLLRQTMNLFLMVSTVDTKMPTESCPVLFGPWPPAATALGLPVN